MLERIGMTSGEVKVYLALVEAGTVTASELTKQTDVYRTSIYDFLEKLEGKGLASHVIKDEVKHFKATDPERLLQYVHNMEAEVEAIIPDIAAKRPDEADDVSVEVYTGIEGFKSVLQDVIKAGDDLSWLGVDEDTFTDTFPEIILKQQIKRMQKHDITERIITSAEAGAVFDTETSQYRYVPAEYFEPTPTAIYADRVMNLVWEPLTAVLMRNEALAKSYTKHFEQLWSLAANTAEAVDRRIHVE